MKNAYTLKSVSGMFISLGLALSLSTGTTAQQQPQKASPARVQVVTASHEMMAPQIYMPGTVVSRNDSRISSEITGRVLWVAAEGSLVKEDDIIAAIDDRIIKLNVARNQSQIKSLEARVDYLKADYGRTQDLAETNNVPANRLEEARSTLVMTEQDLAQARISLEQSEINLARTQIRAPFPGRVVARLAQAGEYAVPGRQVLRLVDTQHLEVSAQVPVSLASVLSDQQRVSLRSDGRMVEASIRALVPVGDAVSRTMEIRVAVPEGGHHVVGAAVQVGLPSSAPEEVVAVPRDALVLRREGTYVFRVKDDNTAERLLVKTGAATGKIVAVSGGILSGDRVVIRGGERLRQGQTVELFEDAASGR